MKRTGSYHSSGPSRLRGLRLFVAAIAVPLSLILLTLLASQVAPALVFAQTIELAYDDARPEVRWSKTEAGVGGSFAVRFSPSLNVSHITSARFYIIDRPAAFNVLILDSDRNSVFEKSATPKKVGWFRVDLSKEDIFVRGEFYVAMKWITAEAPWLGADETKPDGRSFAIEDRRWIPYADVVDAETKQRHGRDGDFMIRASVEAPKDSDGDGLYDFEEARLGTDPKDPDTDDDGLNDADEVNVHRTDPRVKDTDGDALSDGEEVQEYRTDPLKADTDGDGVSDGDEVKDYGSDPSIRDTDHDGLDDRAEIVKGTNPRISDSDRDGLNDGEEVYKHNTDPLKVDTDSDELSDGDEIKIHGTNPLAKDTDGDGVDDGDEIAKGTNPTVSDRPIDRLGNYALLIIAIIALAALAAWRLLLRRRKAKLPPTPRTLRKKYCIHCGVQIDQRALFCPSCGGKQPPVSTTTEVGDVAFLR